LFFHLDFLPDLINATIIADRILPAIFIRINIEFVLLKKKLTMVKINKGKTEINDNGK